MLVRRTTLLLLGAVGLASTALPGRAADAPLKVVASFSILGDMVRQIGGAHVELATLVGPDGDAHMFEPTPADAEKLASARLLVVNGLGFESWLPRLVAASGFAGTTVVASDGARLRSLDEAEEHDHAHDGHHHDHHDPHAWQDLANGVIYARNIGQALAKADPAHAEDYRRAGLPMLPLTHGSELTRLHMFLYTLVLLAATLLPFLIGMSGPIYCAAALVLGVMFAGHAWRLWRSYSDALARQTFRFSIWYLMLIFAALLVDHYAWPALQAVIP